MTFSSDLEKFTAKVRANSQKIFVNTTSHAFESIVNGSPVTGAPGQPVDTGNLRNSWQLTFPAQTEALIATNVDYAVHVEENIRGVTFKNHGPHSVRLTALGMNRIVEAETRKAVG